MHKMHAGDPWIELPEHPAQRIEVVVVDEKAAHRELGGGHGLGHPQVGLEIGLPGPMMFRLVGPLPGERGEGMVHPPEHPVADGPVVGGIHRGGQRHRHDVELRIGLVFGCREEMVALGFTARRLRDAAKPGDVGLARQRLQQAGQPASGPPRHPLALFVNKIVGPAVGHDDDVVVLASSSGCFFGHPLWPHRSISHPHSPRIYIV